MTENVQRLEARLAELRDARDALVVSRTKEDVSEAAQAFLAHARAHSQGVGGHVVSGHATGQPLDDVLRAFLLSDPKFEGWLVEQAEPYAELTAKQRDSRLRKLNGEITQAEAELREARKAAAIAEIEAEFAA
jgi:hypothetical protein